MSEFDDDKTFEKDLYSCIQHSMAQRPIIKPNVLRHITKSDLTNLKLLPVARRNKLAHLYVRQTFVDHPIHKGFTIKGDDLVALAKTRSETELQEMVAAYAELDIQIQMAESAIDDLMDAKPSISRIEKPPGHNLVAILTTILSRKRFEKIFAQVIGDAHEEYFKALAAGDEPEAKKIARELNFDILKTCIEWVLEWPASVVTRVFKGATGKGD